VEEAIAALKRAVAIAPDFALAHNNLGSALQRAGRIDDAIAAYRRALELSPGTPQVHQNLGAALHAEGDADGALAAFARALRLKPDLSTAWKNLAAVQMDVGLLDESLASSRRALDLAPDDHVSHSNLIYTMQFHPAYDAAAIRAELENWRQRHADALERAATAPEPRHPHGNRRLRIGFVSPDFREHAQALFTVPLLGHLNKERLEIFCYSDVGDPDSVTDRLKNLADHWRDIAGLPDQRVAEMVRSDELDILVDLTMHMQGNRLLVFARKPAPVQVTWLAYPGSTGLRTIDARVTDPYLDPPDGQTDRFYSERSLRLPATFWCYDPLSDEPAVGPSPAARDERVTFGCINNFAKINDGAIDLWTRVLRGVSDSRLLLLAGPGAHRQRALERFERDGVDGGRIEFISPCPRPRYLELYHRIDVGLDPFPYNGHTTTLDELWMGVPLVTMPGATVVGRGGASILSNLGVPELIADSPEAYVRLAVALAHDVSRMERLRRELRDRMRASPLMDHARFAADMETLFRGLIA
jgi:predicted O-linked N-acetylglucosamine transferase (SPINDLY family)